MGNSCQHPQQAIKETTEGWECFSCDQVLVTAREMEDPVRYKLTVLLEEESKGLSEAPENSSLWGTVPIALLILAIFLLTGCAAPIKDFDVIPGPIIPDDIPVRIIEVKPVEPPKPKHQVPAKTNQKNQAPTEDEDWPSKEEIDEHIYYGEYLHA